jgi:drug/metabolite transporter (DMT)-like permease
VSGAGRSLNFGPGERWAWAAALSFATVDVMIRAAASNVDGWLGSMLNIIPLTILAWVMLARTGFAEYRRTNPAYLGGLMIGGLVFGGFVGYVIGNVFFFRALVDGGLAIGVNALQGGNVWGGLILGAIILRERPSREQVLGGVVIVLGLAVIAISRLDAPSDSWFVGLVLALAAGACYATTNVFTRLVQRHRAAMYAVLAAASTGGLVPLAAVVGVRAAMDPSQFAGLQLRDVALLLLAGVVAIMAMVSIAQAMRHTAVATVNAIGSAAVVFTLLASIVIFGESAPPLMLFGVAIVIGGILVGQSVTQAPGAEPEIPEEAEGATAE